MTDNEQPDTPQETRPTEDAPETTPLPDAITEPMEADAAEAATPTEDETIQDASHADLDATPASTDSELGADREPESEPKQALDAEAESDWDPALTPEPEVVESVNPSEEEATTETPWFEPEADKPPEEALAATDTTSQVAKASTVSTAHADATAAPEAPRPTEEAAALEESEGPVVPEDSTEDGAVLKHADDDWKHYKVAAFAATRPFVPTTRPLDAAAHETTELEDAETAATADGDVEAQDAVETPDVEEAALSDAPVQEERVVDSTGQSEDGDEADAEAQGPAPEVAETETDSSEPLASPADAEEEDPAASNAEADDAPEEAQETAAANPQSDDEKADPFAAEEEALEALDEDLEPVEMLGREESCQALYALLFVSDRPMSAKRLAEALGDMDTEIVVNLLDEIRQDIESHPGLPYTLREIAGGYQLVTKAEFAPFIRRLFQIKKSKRLSKALMETLAIIAYKQPVTRAEVEAIRGVSVSHAFEQLQDRRMIKVSGVSDLPGRPKLYRTTEDFLLQFGLGSLHELPSLEELQEMD